MSRLVPGPGPVELSTKAGTYGESRTVKARSKIRSGTDTYVIHCHTILVLLDTIIRSPIQDDLITSCGQCGVFFHSWNTFQNV